ARGVYHGNLLKARMKITTYNLHDCSFRPRALWVLKQPQFTWGQGAVVVIQSSGAPQNCLENEFERRGVEGSRHCIVARYCVKAFSREFPDAAWVLHTFSGSFDCAPFSFPKGQLLVALRSG